MLVELTLRRKPPRLTNNSPIDGIRILALLPREWLMDLRQATGDVVIRVYTEGSASSAEIRSEVARALTDPSVCHWHLVACDTCAIGSFEAKE
jgi:hypothetical protein